MPEFVDIDRRTLNVNVDLLENQVKTDSSIMALLPVHFAGLPCDMEEINRIAKEHNLKVIEDAAHALGANYKTGEKVGSCIYSDMTVLSFHPVKSITTGEGGMVTTNDIDLYRSLLRLRSHGISKLDDEFQNLLLSRTSGSINPWYYEMVELGFNYRMTEIQAVLGINQLRRLDKFIAKRRKKVQTYLRLLKGQEIIRFAQDCELNTSSHHILPVRIDFPKTGFSRNTFMKALRASGVGSQVHYIPIPLQPYYKSLGYDILEIPEALAYYEECLTLPLYPDLKYLEQKKVSKVLKSFSKSEFVLD